jgi:hypothetical protein
MITAQDSFNKARQVSRGARKITCAYRFSKTIMSELLETRFWGLFNSMLTRSFTVAGRNTIAFTFALQMATWFNKK